MGVWAYWNWETGYSRPPSPLPASLSHVSTLTYCLAPLPFSCLPLYFPLPCHASHSHPMSLSPPSHTLTQSHYSLPLLSSLPQAHTTMSHSTGTGKHHSVPKRYALFLACSLLLAIALLADFLWASSYSSPSSSNEVVAVSTPLQPPSIKKKETKAVNRELMSLNATYADIPAPHWDWEEMPDAPVPRLDGFAIQLENLLYVFAGYGSIDHVHSHVDIFNFTSNTWDGRFDMPKEMANSHLGMATDGRYIYAISGQYGPQCRRPTNRNFALDTKTKQWSELPSLPVPR